MSGSNPFRRSQNIAGFSSIPNSRSLGENDRDTIAAARRFPSLNIEPPSSIDRPSSKTKTVRIASPPATTPISPDYFSSEPDSPVNIRQAGTSPSPQNDSASDDDDDDEGDNREDPFEADTLRGNDDYAREQVLQNTRTNSTIASSGDPNKQEEESDAVRRTLARFSARPSRGPVPHAATIADVQGPEPAQTKGKQQLDVDAFKRLLMTGNASVLASQEGAPLPGIGSQHVPVSESSSNTDTASVSRQSIFEPLPMVPSDTPRTSHEGSPEMVDDDQRRLVASEEKKKPPPPKTRHGKLIKNPPPAALSQQIPTMEAQSTSDSLRSPIHPGQSSTSLDVSSSAASEGYFTKTVPMPSPLGITSPSSTPTPKRGPTPPVARRKSQREPPKPGLAGESMTNVPPPMHSPSAAPMTGGHLTSTGSSKTPPAPPVSRGKRSGSILSPIMQTGPANSVPTPNAESPSSINTAMTGDTPVSPPPLPLVRNPSGSSLRSQKRLSRPAGALGGMAPPPPPPRRNRESSRGSMDSQRPSAQTIADAVSTGEIGSGRTSGESSRNVSNSSTANDILADIAALQREVDELRRRQNG